MEFALVLPFLVVVVLGVTELGYALLDSHIVTQADARGLEPDFARCVARRMPSTAMRNISSRPVNFNDGSSKIIFSVIKNVATDGAANYDKAILYQRYVYGSFPGTSAIHDRGNRVLRRGAGLSPPPTPTPTRASRSPIFPAA